MALTVAGTTVDTAWTEQSTVDFTAGTLATASECLDAVEGKLSRGTLSDSSQPTQTQVYNWLIRAKAELASVKDFTFRRRYASMSTVADQYRYSLPPDYNGGNVTLRNTTADYEAFIRFIDNSHYDKLYPRPADEESDEPVIATIKNRELWINPPSGVFTLELEYGRSGDDITPTDFSWLPQIERWRCVDFACAESFECLHQFDLADRYMRKWAEGLGRSFKADSRRRWASRHYQALGWWQQ